jgi:hypothetical protein
VIEIPIEDHRDFHLSIGYSKFFPVACPKTAQSAIGISCRSDLAVYVPIYSNGGIEKAALAWNSLISDFLKLKDRKRSV